jgi:hypothetical protein
MRVNTDVHVKEIRKIIRPTGANRTRYLQSHFSDMNFSAYQ